MGGYALFPDHPGAMAGMACAAEWGWPVKRANEKTGLTTRMPWGLIEARGSRVLCSDGKIRAPHWVASTADTFFSVPASVRVKGKVITGYVTAENFCGTIDVVTLFRQHDGQEDKGLPVWPDRLSPEYETLIRSALGKPEVLP